MQASQTNGAQAVELAAARQQIAELQSDVTRMGLAEASKEVTISVEASPWPRSPASSVVQGASREVQKIRDDLIAALQSAVRSKA